MAPIKILPRNYACISSETGDFIRSMLSGDTFSHKHNVEMERLVPEICFGHKKDLRTKNLQEN
jgi:hypothetical protein